MRSEDVSDDYLCRVVNLFATSAGIPKVRDAMRWMGLVDPHYVGGKKQVGSQMMAVLTLAEKRGVPEERVVECMLMQLTCEVNEMREAGQAGITAPRR